MIYIIYFFFVYYLYFSPTNFITFILFPHTKKRTFGFSLFFFYIIFTEIFSSHDYFNNKNKIYDTSRRFSFTVILFFYYLKVQLNFFFRKTEFNSTLNFATIKFMFIYFFLLFICWIFNYIRFD